jgi:hypothetical protein
MAVNTSTTNVTLDGAYAQAGALDFVLLPDGRLSIEHEKFSCQWEPGYAEFDHAELSLEQTRALRDLLNRALPA